MVGLSRTLPYFIENSNNSVRKEQINLPFSSRALLQYHFFLAYSCCIVSEMGPYLEEIKT